MVCLIGSAKLNNFHFSQARVDKLRLIKKLYPGFLTLKKAGIGTRALLSTFQCLFKHVELLI